MKYNALVGWKFKIQWSDGDIEDFYIVEENTTNTDLYNIQCISKFAQELNQAEPHKEHSYKVDDIEYKFTILELVNDNVEKIIQDRNLTKIYHFTPIENIPNILKYGLLSRLQLSNNNINHIINDEQRFDNHSDCISCSLEHPNFKLLYKNKMNLNRKYCLIEIDISILKNQYSVCSKTNAAKNAGRDIMPIFYLEKLFEEPRPKSLPQYYTTDEQAELLIKGPIPLNYIKSIIFDDFSIYKQYKDLPVDNINFEYKPILFTSRGDYE